eukprot:gnl/MRDRNA2_/MRDRNA2_81934_c0_seq6.p1 gnl/MRDRNA2_/MRDRNA2_81934_c0~~gnl/MRDRNA2_/MRDRNA2_81934_c0_seq6.p1  ORF type:complete len:608 (-),score=176.68 gnl/MRDRNA2_/MRDRNA2_81934_c0_seq6:233-2056(-)
MAAPETATRSRLSVVAIEESLEEAEMEIVLLRKECDSYRAKYESTVMKAMMMIMNTNTQAIVGKVLEAWHYSLKSMKKEQALKETRQNAAEKVIATMLGSQENILKSESFTVWHHKCSEEKWQRQILELKQVELQQQIELTELAGQISDLKEEVEGAPAVQDPVRDDASAPAIRRTTVEALEMMETDVESIEKQRDSLLEQLKQAQAQNAGQLLRAEEMEKEIVALHSKLDESQSEADSLRYQKKDSDNRIKNLERDLEKQKKGQESQLADLEAAQAKLQETQQAIAQERRMSKDLHKTLETQRRQSSMLMMMNTMQTKKDTKEVEAKSKVHEVELEQLRRDLAVVKSQNEKYLDVIQQLHEHNADNESYLEQIAELSDEDEVEDDGEDEEWVDETASEASTSISSQRLRGLHRSTSRGLARRSIFQEIKNAEDDSERHAQGVFFAVKAVECFKKSLNLSRQRKSTKESLKTQEENSESDGSGSVKIQSLRPVDQEVQTQPVTVSSIQSCVDADIQTSPRLYRQEVEAANKLLAEAVSNSRASQERIVELENRLQQVSGHGGGSSLESTDDVIKHLEQSMHLVKHWWIAKATPKATPRQHSSSAEGS